MRCLTECGAPEKINNRPVYRPPLEAGQRSAILYTMMEECKRCKVDSLAWLTWVLNRLPNYQGDYSDLYPEAMPNPQTQAKQRPI